MGLKLNMLIALFAGYRKYN